MAKRFLVYNVSNVLYQLRNLLYGDFCIDQLEVAVRENGYPKLS